MHQIRSRHKRRIKQFEQSGYVLPLVIITGLILIVGAVILSTRSFSGLIRSTRQRQADEAIEIAETGTSILINELNSKFPYLLTVNCQVENNLSSEQLQNPICDGWENFEFGQYGGADSACPARSENPSEAMELLYKNVEDDRGSYRLRNYEFLGDQIQGGKAIIQVQGQRFKSANESSDIAATAIIEQEITVVPKCCDGLPYQECSIGVGDIIDEKSSNNASTNNETNSNSSNSASYSASEANVHCTSCDTPPSDQCTGWKRNGIEIQNIPLTKKSDCENGVDISEDMAGIIDGKRTNGSIDVPPAPTWNKQLWGDPVPFTIGYDPYRPELGYNAPTISHGDTEGPQTNNPACYTEITNEKKITHCRIKNISTSIPLNLEINPDKGDIRFYVEGNQIDLAGIYFIIPEETEFGQFTIFGGESTWESAYEKFKSSAPGSKSFNWSGGGEINAFLYMPYFNVNFSGGSCEGNQKQILRGTAITYGWNATGDCSQIKVPAGASKTVCEDYGVCLSTSSAGTSDSEFAALGSNRWSLIQMEQE